MRVSLAWLTQYVPLPPIEELVPRLTAVGFEVEAVERVGGELAGVVAARIVAAEKHPQSEKLSVVRVDSGAGEPLQIVCGASNAEVGAVAALAPVGAKLPGGREVDKKTFQGAESFGMLCSAKELGLSTDASGLLLLPPEVKPGTPIAEALGLEDTILEVNVTPNRPDCLSHLGIAREVAALEGTAVRPPEPGLRQRGAPASDLVQIAIEDPEKCHRYAARVIEDVKLAPSPPWLARRLETCGVRAIGNVVDATNFVLLELGHPLHAFDLDRVAGAEIAVRAARPGERLTTLDGQERRLDPDDLVIADRDRAMALGGVMGGADSEISAGTTRVLLESAWFQPQTVRRSSRRHGLRTEASQRFERGADPGMVIPALDRCAALIAELSGGTVRRGWVDVHPQRHRPVRVALTWSRPAQLLGMPVRRGQVRRILRRLGFEEGRPLPRGAIFKVPSWRADVSGEEDLVEEIARTVGYDRIPETLPAVAAAIPALSPAEQAAERVRQSLEGAGFCEAVNFSFVAPGDLDGISDGAEAIALKNPISAEMAVMRTSLVPSLLRNAAHNLRQRIEDIRLYELASVYRRLPPGLTSDTPAREDLRLAAVALGRRSPAGWATAGDPFDFYDLKAALEGLFEGLRIPAVRFSPGGEPWLHPRAAAAVEIDGADGAREVLGSAGEIHPRVAAAFELPAGTFAFELAFEGLLRSARLVPRYRGVPRFPAVLRDLAVVVADEVPAERILSSVRGEPLVEEVRLFDVYRGVPIAAGKKNIAMAIRYRAPDRTLTDAEAEAAHARILARLRADPAVRAELRD